MHRPHAVSDAKPASEGPKSCARAAACASSSSGCNWRNAEERSRGQTEFDQWIPEDANGGEGKNCNVGKVRNKQTRKTSRRKKKRLGGPDTSKDAEVVDRVARPKRVFWTRQSLRKAPIQPYR
jgi:hypothetical protein